MTATNHMLAGAALALSIQRPLLVAAFALLSHFVLDALPHFGIHEKSALKRHKHPLFVYILIVDVILAATFLVALPIMFSAVIPWQLVVLGMLLAWLPDVIWTYRYVYEIYFDKLYGHSWFSHAHHKIQWFERPAGLMVEIAWLGGMAFILGSLAA